MIFKEDSLVIDRLLSLEISKDKNSLHRLLRTQEKLKKGFIFDYECLEYYPLYETLALLDYLNDLSVDYPDNSKLNEQLILLEHILIHNTETSFSIEKDVFSRKMQYGYVNNSVLGRIYPKFLSIPYMSKEIRYCLFNGFYYDIDFENCLPSLVLGFAENIELISPSLNNLFYDRNAFYDNLKGSGISDPKKSVLRCFNLHNYNFSNVLLHQLNKDLSIIRELMWYKHKILNSSSETSYKGVYKSTDFLRYLDNCDKNANKKEKVSMMAKSFQFLESEALKAVRLSFEEEISIIHKKTFMIDDNNSSFIPFFDGAFVRSNNSVVNPEIPKIIEKLNEKIKKHHSYMKLKLKPIEPNFSLLNEDTFNRYVVLKKWLTLRDNHVNVKRISTHFDITTNILSDISINLIKLDAKKSKNFRLDEKTKQQLIKDSKLFSKVFREHLIKYADSIDSLDTFYKEISK